MRLIGIDPAGLDRELAARAQRSALETLRLRQELEEACQETARLQQHLSLLSSNLSHAEAQHSEQLSALLRALSEHETVIDAARDQQTDETERHQSAISDLTERIEGCAAVREQLLRGLASLLAPFLSTPAATANGERSPGKEAAHA